MNGEPTQSMEPSSSSSGGWGEQPAESLSAQMEKGTLEQEAPKPTPVPGQMRVPGWDTIATPHYLPALPPPVRNRLGRGARAGIAAALVMSSVALLISALMLAGAWRVRNATVAGLDDVIAQLDAVCGASAQPIIIPISQTIHFKSDIALPGNLVIPFKGNIPINTIVRISVAGLPGSPMLEVPINTTVPVDTRVPIPGGISIPVSLDVPINQRIPVDLCAGGGPMKAMLERTIRDIGTVRDSLNFP
jgi:hypothetical protein